MPEKVLDRIRGADPARAPGPPEEVARVVHFLAADAVGLHHRAGLGRQRRAWTCEQPARRDHPPPARAEALSMRQFARMAGISNPYLSQIERGLREPVRAGARGHRRSR